MRMYAECREMVGVHQPFGLPAATLGCCAVIDFTLSASRASRYRHAARHLAEYSSLAPHIDDYGGAPDHAAYLRALRAAHPASLFAPPRPAAAGSRMTARAALAEWSRSVSGVAAGRGAVRLFSAARRPYIRCQKPPASKTTFSVLGERPRAPT